MNMRALEIVDAYRIGKGDIINYLGSWYDVARTEAKGLKVGIGVELAPDRDGTERIGWLAFPVFRKIERVSR